MSSLLKAKRCKECGVLLQSANPNFPGYVNQEILDSSIDECFCNSCIEANRRLNEQKTEVDKEYFKILEKIKKDKALVVYVVDLFSFEQSFIPSVTENLKGCDIIAVGNKLDLIPSDTKIKELTEYVSNQFKEANLKIKDTVLTSTFQNRNIDVLYRKIRELCKGKDVYFLGASVSGKSAILNAFIKEFNNETDEPIMTITFEGTKLRGFRIPLGNKNYVYECPGLPINNSIVDKVEYHVARQIEPSSQIRAQVFKLSTYESILFGSIAMFEMLKGDPQRIEVYCNNAIELKVFKKGENVVSNTLLKQGLKPSSKLLKSYSSFEAYDISIDENGFIDIGILGLGWIKIIGNKQAFRVFVPKGVSVFVTPSKNKNAIKIK